MTKVSFDLISDLNLGELDEFNWNEKRTSLHCIVAGSISRNPRVIRRVLSTLSTQYWKVFYIDGSLEQSNPAHRDSNVEYLSELCESLNNVIYLYDTIPVIQGVALVGMNGWYGNDRYSNTIANLQAECWRGEDEIYAASTMTQLQEVDDIKKIVMVSKSVPCKELFFGEHPDNLSKFSPNNCLAHDYEDKVSHWVFGSYKKVVDTKLDGVNYLNNAYNGQNPYYAKWFEVTY